MVEKSPWRQKNSPTKTVIGAWFAQRGLKTHTWSNEPGYLYEDHRHLYTKVLFCLSGSIVFQTEKGNFELARGDQLVIPAGVSHRAVVGEEGVTCIEAAVGTDFG